MSKARVLKSDAVIKIEIGTGFVQKLQQIYIYMMTNMKKEDLEKYQKELSEVKTDINEKVFEEDYMNHLTTLGILLNEISNLAEKQGMTYEQDLSQSNTNL